MPPKKALGLYQHIHYVKNSYISDDGCIKVTLTDSLTEEEKIEFKEWIFDQNEEGIGKIFEQQSRLIAEGELHISFRSRDDDYFIEDETEFQHRLNQNEVGYEHQQVQDAGLVMGGM